MGLNIGSDAIRRAYWGADEVSQVYLGGALLFQKPQIVRSGAGTTSMGHGDYVCGKAATVACGIYKRATFRVVVALAEGQTDPVKVRLRLGFHLPSNTTNNGTYYESEYFTISPNTGAGAVSFEVSIPADKVDENGETYILTRLGVAPYDPSSTTVETSNSFTSELELSC